MPTTANASAARTRTRVRYTAFSFRAGHPTLFHAAVVQARVNECIAPRLRWPLAMSILMIWLISVTPAHAQLATQHIKGVVGLKGGSPPPPGTYFIAPLVYIYNTDTVRTREGNRLPIDAHISSVAVAGGFNLVTTKQILGGYYGFQVLFPVWANNRIQARKYHAATVASFNVQSTKESSETKVGNAMNLDGGVGADFLGGGLSAGLVYYASFKLTADRKPTPVPGHRAPSSTSSPRFS